MIANASSVLNLRCDFRVNPLGIDSPYPCLSWTMQSETRNDIQTAYQILVAKDPIRLKNGRGDIWNSGKVADKRSIGINYAGSALESRTIYYWKVRIWNRANKPTSWSEVSTWEMGLLTPKEWCAQWLNDGKMNPTHDEDFYKEDSEPLFRCEFAVKKPIKRARLYISGLGYYETTLNGSRVGNHVLDPGWTRYSERVLYSTYDVTSQLSSGLNCIGVKLGNGWYNPLPLRMWGTYNLRDHMPVGRPRFIAQLDLEYTDGRLETIVSDTGWKVNDGPVSFNSIYLGEIYDARKELRGWDLAGFDDSKWRTPFVATEKLGPLYSQAQPPIRITKSLYPLALTEPLPGVYIFDMGQNYAGWANLRYSAPAGTKIVLRYGELLHPDGTLNPMTSVAGQVKYRHKNAEGKEESIGGPGAPTIAWQSDTVITAGTGLESYTPRYTFHSFRYMEVAGLPARPSLDDVTGLRLNSDVERTGSFACSNDMLNRIHEICDRTFLSNLFSVQSDCPHREKFGYGGDLAVTSEAFMMNYDMSGFYTKAVHDLQDSAQSDGMFTDTSPFVGIQYCGVAWAMAHPLAQRLLYKYYGERRLIEKQYQASKRWLDLVAQKYPDHIVTDGLSDHEALTPNPPAIMVTPLYAASAHIISELATIIGRNDDAKKYAILAQDIRQAYAAKFVDPATGRVGEGTQASQSFALCLDLVPQELRPAVLRTLTQDIDAKKQHLSTGIFGTQFMLDALSREGHAGLAYAIVNQKTFPGWGYMLENGATTLWEHWEGSDNTFSHNHPMFGSVSQWLYQWLGGIQPDHDAVGFDHIIIRPQVVGDLIWVKCSYASIHGLIASNWKRDGNIFTLEVEIPANTSALVYLPTSCRNTATESGVPIASASEVKFEREETNAAIYRVGGGKYIFTCQML